MELTLWCILGPLFFRFWAHFGNAEHFICILQDLHEDLLGDEGYGLVD